MDRDALSLLRCPITHQKLVPASEEEVSSADGRFKYAARDGIFVLGAPRPRASDLQGSSIPSEGRTEKQMVVRFYDEYGWVKDERDLYGDTRLFVALDPVARGYTGRCIREIVGLLSTGGRFLLDAGSGAIPLPEYLEFHQRYERGVCVDLSLRALEEAKKKLGDRGIYVVGDLTNLPIDDGVVDAAVSLHLIYHIPADQQHTAFTELARVLKPSGRAIVVYRWDHSPLAWCLAKLFELLRRLTGGDRTSGEREQKAESTPPLYFHAHPREWFTRPVWSFSFSIRSFHIIDNTIMKTYFSPHWLWRMVAWAL